MNEPLSRYNITVTVGRGGGCPPDPAADRMLASALPVRICAWARIWPGGR